MPKQVSAIRSQADELRRRAIGNMVTLITTAFGLVAALAWNTAIQTAFTDFFGKQSTLAAMFAYAIVVTIIAVVFVTYLSKLGSDRK